MIADVWMSLSVSFKPPSIDTTKPEVGSTAHKEEEEEEVIRPPKPSSPIPPKQNLRCHQNLI